MITTVEQLAEYINNSTELVEPSDLCEIIAENGWYDTRILLDDYVCIDEQRMLVVERDNKEVYHCEPITQEDINGLKQATEEEFNRL